MADWNALLEPLHLVYLVRNIAKKKQLMPGRHDIVPGPDIMSPVFTDLEQISSTLIRQSAAEASRWSI